MKANEDQLGGEKMNLITIDEEKCKRDRLCG